MLLIHSSGGVRARMTPTSLCMICAANHIMRFPDWPSFLFSQLCKEPLFGKYCIFETPDNSLYRAHTQWGLLKPFIHFRLKPVSAPLVWKVGVARGYRAREQPQTESDQKGLNGDIWEWKPFPLILFLFMQCNMRRCRCTPGYGAISYSHYVLTEPFFTCCLIRSLGAWSWLCSCTAVPAHQWGSALLS